MGRPTRTWEQISPDFKDVQEFIDTFEASDFVNANSSERYFSFFGLNEILTQLDVDRIRSTENALYRSVSVEERKPFAADYGDLARLHWLVLRARCETGESFCR